MWDARSCVDGRWEAHLGLGVADEATPCETNGPNSVSPAAATVSLPRRTTPRRCRSKVGDPLTASLCGTAGGASESAAAKLADPPAAPSPPTAAEAFDFRFASRAVASSELSPAAAACSGSNEAVQANTHSCSTSLACNAERAT